jgi:preprotein translocase subunit SecA
MPTGWAPVYEFLGLSVGVIRSGQTPAEKREAYAADITYGTNNEFGFDYLRDNMAFSNPESAATPALRRGRRGRLDPDRRGAYAADHLRPADDSRSSTPDQRWCPGWRQEEEDGPGDFSVDEKAKQVHLTEDGTEGRGAAARGGLLEAGESLYDAGSIMLVHHLTPPARARAVPARRRLHRRDGQIVIVDEFTGRTMPGRRWSDGLHQAIEAKEGRRDQRENQTLASITFQNYFRCTKSWRA